MVEIKNDLNDLNHREECEVNKDQAIQAAQQAGVAPGDYITLQNIGQIEHDHFHAGQSSGTKHVDGWKVANNEGNLQATKIHSDY